MADLIQVKPLIDPSTPYPATVGDAVGEMQRKGFTSSSNAFRYVQQSLDIIHRALRKGSELVTDIIGAIQRQLYTYSADTGVADAYVVTLSPKPLLVPGSEVVFKAANANTGASTLVVNGGSPIAITKQGATALVAGDIAEGQIVTVVYDGTNWQILAGSGGGGGAGTPSDTVADLDGTGDAGASTDYSRGDHKHADTARHTHANQSTLDNITAAYTSAEATKLAGIEAGAEVNVNADWNAGSGDAQILNRPTLATVATSGSYTDLTDKPTIPSVPDLASQAEAEAGTENTKIMTALRVAQAITALAPEGGSSTGELLMQDGVTAPPVPIETEDQTDWLYQG